MKKRKKRSQEEWESIVNKQKESGKNIKTYCKENGIAESGFYKFKQRIKEKSSFSEIKVSTPKKKENIKMKINGNEIEFEATLLLEVVQAIKVADR